MAENDGIIIPFIADMSKFDDAIKGTIDLLVEFGDITNDTATKYKTAQAAMAQSTQGTTSEVKNLNEGFKQLGANIAGGALRQGQKDIQDLAVAAAKAANEIKLIASQIAADTKALRELSAAGKEGSAAFKQIEQDIARLNTAMGQIREGIKSTSAEFKGLTIVRDTLKGLSTGLETAAKMSQLFGTKNEEVEKTLEAVNEVTAVFNGVAAIANTIKETAVRLSRAEAVATQLAALAESEYTVIRWAAVAAQEALNAAMEANPAGLMIGVIGALAGGLAVLNNATEDAAEKQKKLNEAQAAGLEILKTSIELNKKMGDDRVRNAESNVAELKANKASTDEIRDAEAKLDEQRIKAAENQPQLVKKMVENFKLYKNDYLQEQKDLNEKIALLEKDLKNGTNYQGKRGFNLFGGGDEPIIKQMEDLKARLKTGIDEYNTIEGVYNQIQDAKNAKFDNDKKRQQEVEQEDLELQLNNLKLKQEKELQGSAAELQIKKDEIDAEVKLNESKLEKDESYITKKALLEAEAEKKKKDLDQQYNVTALENAKANFDAENLMLQEGSQAELDFKLKDLEKQAEIDKAKLKNTADRADQEKRISEKLTADQTKLTKDFNDKQRADAYQAQVVIEQTRLEVVQKGSKDELAAKKAVLVAENKVQLNNIETTIKNEQLKAAEVLKANADLKKKLEEADTAFIKEDANRNNAHASKMVELAQSNADLVNGNPASSEQDKVKAQNAVRDAQIESIKTEQKGQDELFENYKKNFNAEVDCEEALQQVKDDHDTQTQINKNKIAKLQQDNAKAETDAEKAKQAKQEADLKKYGDMAIDYAKKTTDQIFQLENEARNAKFNADIERIQKTANFELDNHNLTQAQKIAIQRKYDKEIAAEKLKQWKADQKAKEEQAIINGFLAITNILATMNWADFGAAQAIAIATSVASTAASVAGIAAQKPPAFASGTPAGTPDAPFGLKLVGEEGPELIYTRGGERIIPAPETAEIFMRYGIPAMPAVNELEYEQALNTALPAINEDSLAKKIAHELSKNPVANINMDKDGFSTYLLQRGNRRLLLNNKFRS